MFKIFLYSDRAPLNLGLDEVGDYLVGKGFDVEVCGDFFSYLGVKAEDVAGDHARVRISDMTCEGVLNSDPSLGDVDAELDIINGTEPLRLLMDLSNVYSGWDFVSLFRGFLKSGFHVVFTGRMLATWSDRYHGRTVLIHPPLAVVSTTGVVEAPKKPTEYYARLLGYEFASKMGHSTGSFEEFENNLKESFKDSFIDYDDSRLTKVLKGFVMQSLVYTLSGDVFCDDPGCRLFDAHTQEDLLRSQLLGDEFCSRHTKMVDGFNKI